MLLQNPTLIPMLHNSHHIKLKFNLVPCEPHVTGMRYPSSDDILLACTDFDFTDVAGAFWLYTGFGVVGLIFVLLFVPETKGKSLEEVEELFKKPWCSGQSSQTSDR